MDTTPGTLRTHAAAWARVARRAVETPYPYVTGHVSQGPDDVDVTPSRLHPAFHGSFDWHSSVHMQWSLLTLLSRYGGELGAAREAGPVQDLLGRRWTSEAVSSEVAYLRQRPGFERPYGWAWAAVLAAAAHGGPWGATLRPLGEVVADLVAGWLPRQDYPVRHGKHQNDAFALRLLLPSMRTLGRDDVAQTVEQTALRWFGPDRASDTRGEPGGSDFLSPSLTEADLMRLVLGESAPSQDGPAGEFGRWLEDLLPGLGAGQHEHLLQVPDVSDRSDGQSAHLVGLCLSRAWQLRALAPWLSEGAATQVLDASGELVDAVLPDITDGNFMATHWLVSFALLAEGVPPGDPA